MESINDTIAGTIINPPTNKNMNLPNPGIINSAAYNKITVYATSSIMCAIKDIIRFVISDLFDAIIFNLIYLLYYHF